MSKEKAIEAVEKSEDYKNIMMALAAEQEQLYLLLLILSTTWSSRRQTYIRRLINSYYNYFNGNFSRYRDFLPARGFCSQISAN